MFRMVKLIPGAFTAFTVDNLDNLYILNNRNQLKKMNANGDSVAVFNNVKRYGEATFIDASNPLKVLLYYKDFATIAMLDRLLNVRNTIDLRKQNILQVKAIGQSYDNKIWLYDELDSKLKKIDDDGNLLQETPDFRLLLGKAISPVKIFDENKYVYLYDPENGVYVFDYYGALKNNIMIRNWENFRVSGKFIYGSRADTIFRYEISTFLLDEWKMPQALLKSRSFNFTTTRLYALKEEGITIYTIR
jgi:hypothetical protein